MPKTLKNNTQNASEKTLNKLYKYLICNNLMLVTAESCTGGLIAARCTEIAGSSQWFDRGFVTYSNQAKQEMLGVPAALIEQYGAVSQQVVEAMALGAIRKTENSDGKKRIAISVSGIAGPDGGSEEKPVGTVWLGFAENFSNGSSKKAQSRLLNLSGTRSEIRQQAVTQSLDWILELAESGN